MFPAILHTTSNWSRWAVRENPIWTPSHVIYHSHTSVQFLDKSHYMYLKRLACSYSRSIGELLLFTTQSQHPFQSEFGRYNPHFSLQWSNSYIYNLNYQKKINSCLLLIEGHLLSQIIVISGEWIKSSQLLPSLTKLFCGVVMETTYVSTNHGDSKHVHVQHFWNHQQKDYSNFYHVQILKNSKRLKYWYWNISVILRS